jgi:hypothetical protein
MKPYRGLALAIATVTLALFGIAMLEFVVAQSGQAQSLWAGLGALGIVLPGFATLLAFLVALLIRE